MRCLLVLPMFTPIYTSMHVYSWDYLYYKCKENQNGVIFFFIDMLVEESTHAWRARGWYVMDKDKVIHIYLAHPPSTIFYLPVNMGNKVGQVSYFDGIQPHVFNADKTIMQYMPVYKCATRHKSMQQSKDMHSFIVKMFYGVHVDNFYQTPKLTTMYIICISYPLQS